MLKFISNLAASATGNGLIGSQLSIGGIQVTVKEEIAHGGFGSIYTCTDNSGRTYALKALQAPDEDHYNAILKEFEFQKKVSSHPNMVKVYGLASEKAQKQALILMEYCEGNCVNAMNQVFSQGFTSRKIVEIFEALVNAVDCLHNQNPPISHRDLKIENVLLSGGTWKLCDFGSATERTYDLETQEERNIAADDIQRNTTAPYRAPEMCDLYRRQKITTKSDIWALGCVLFKLCTFKDAFGEGSNLQILNVKYSWPPEKQVDEHFKQICAACFKTNPDERPTTKGVLALLAQYFPEYVSSATKSIAASEKKKPHHEEPASSPAPKEEPVHTSPPSEPEHFSPSFEQAPAQHSSFQQTAFQNQQSNAPNLLLMDDVVSAPKASISPQSSKPEIVDMSIPKSSSIDFNLINTDSDLFVKQLLDKSDFEVTPLVFSLTNIHSEKSNAALFKLISYSGKKAPFLLKSIPTSGTPQIDNLFERQRSFYEQFPQFEGNFSLHSFMQENKANPPAIGNPPMCCEAVKQLLSFIDSAIGALRAAPSAELSDLAASAYIVVAYILAKLKVFKVGLGYVEQTAIPLLQNYHGQLKKIFENNGGVAAFPPEAFNFDDQTFLKKIRPPPSKAI